MRTNRNGVTENSEFNINQEKFDAGITRVFGDRPSPFCDKCDLRHSFCECAKDAEMIAEDKYPENDPAKLDVKMNIRIDRVCATSRQNLLNTLADITNEIRELTDAHFEESGTIYLSSGALEVEL